MERIIQNGFLETGECGWRVVEGVKRKEEEVFRSSRRMNCIWAWNEEEVRGEDGEVIDAEELEEEAEESLHIMHIMSGLLVTWTWSGWTTPPVWVA